MAQEHIAFNQTPSIQLGDVVALGWKIRIGLGIGFMLGAMIGVCVALNLRVEYRTDVLLAPAEEAGVGGMSGLMSKAGALASIAGINLDARSRVSVDAIALITSRRLITQFIRENNVKPFLFPSKYDFEKQEWKEPGIVDRIVARIVPSAASEPSEPVSQREPLSLKAYEEFRDDYLQVSEDKKSGIVTVSVFAPSPQLAKDWADTLVKLLNDTVRKKAISEAELAYKFLQEQSTRTTVIEVNRTLNELAEAQLKTMMIAASREEFAFRTLDPAYVPYRKARPRRSLVVVAFALALSGLLGGLQAIQLSRRKQG